MDKQRKTGLIVLVVGALIVTTTYFWDSIPTSLITLVVIGVVTYGFFRFSQTEVGKKSLNKLKEMGVNMFGSTEDTVESPNYTMGHEGKRINVYSWNLIVRPVVSLLVGLILPLAFLGLNFYFEWGLLNWWILSGVTLFLATLAGSNEFDEPIVVPKTTYGIMSFWENRINLYVKEGKYPWTGSRFGLRISPDVEGKEGGKTEGVDKEGFLSAFDFPIQIWNSSELGVNGKPVLDLISRASNNADVLANLTVNLRYFAAKKWLDSDDPVLFLSEAYRHAFRTAVGFFTDKDAPALESAYARLLMGYTLLVLYKEDGSVVKDRSGHPMFSFIEHEHSKDPMLLNAKIETYLTEVRRMATGDELEKCSNNGKPEVYIKSVHGMLSKKLRGLGVYPVSVAISDVQPSEEVKAQANKASGEDYQLQGQIKSAHAFKESGEIRKKAVKGMTELVQVITAAEDNPEAISIVYAAGGGEFTKAAATHASVSNKGGQK